MIVLIATDCYTHNMGGITASELEDGRYARGQNREPRRVLYALQRRDQARGGSAVRLLSERDARGREGH